MAQDLGRPIVVNIIVLGFLAAKSDVVSSEALKKAVLDSIPAGTEDLNMKAFDLGYKYGTEYTSKKH
jgi:2-oxoglutarate ferredoxin oxidoreductase subunit gamma